MIETNRGAEEFDSKDRALVWRVTGGKHRYLIGVADIFAEDSGDAFRQAALEALSRPATLDIVVLEHEQRRLEQRLSRLGGLQEPRDIWLALGVTRPEAVPALSSDAFLSETGAKREHANDAR